MSDFSPGAHRAETGCPVIERALPGGVSPGTPDEPGRHRAFIGQSDWNDTPRRAGPERHNRIQPRADNVRPVRLRAYQQDCLASLTEAGAAGRSSLGVMPTGSGKSLVIAALMAGLAEAGRRSLMLTHVRELVEQDAAVFQRFAPEQPYGVFCRGLGRFELGSPVVFAQTQSLHARKHLLTEPFDLVVVDEAHLIPFSSEGRYVSLIRLLRDLRPGMPLLGLTATPYRLRGGWLLCGYAEDAWPSGVLLRKVCAVRTNLREAYLAWL